MVSGNPAMSMLTSVLKQLLAPKAAARGAMPIPAGEPHAAHANALLDAFMRNSDRVVHKWLHYFEVYQRAFDRFRGRPLTFLEIGIQNGGSAALWRDYFGPQARIIGVDIDPRCKALESDGFEVWIGDQADPAFWQAFLQAHPRLDVVLDDGGHTMRQQIVTFESLFGALEDGGLYLCEDTHTSYLPAFGGGLRVPGTFHEYVKDLIDEMHAWYHAPVQELEHGAFLAKNILSISIFDSMVLVEKRLKNPPLALARGLQGHVGLPPATTHLDLRRANGVPDAGVPRSPAPDQPFT